MVSAVTASYTLTPFNTQTNNGLLGWTRVTAEIGPGPVTRTLNFMPSFGYSDSPTISYVPVQGTEFANNIMTPIELETLHLFAYGGPNDPNMIFRLAIQSINNLDNASAAANPKPYAVPEFEKYYHFIDVLVPQMREGHCEFRPTEINQNFALSLHCKDPGISQTLKSMLGIPLHTDDMIFVEQAVPHAPSNVVYVQMRSVHGILSYLSHGVQVPYADAYHGLVGDIGYPDGHPFDWGPLMDNLWTVYWSNRKPFDAFVKVYVHHHWFYIKDSDNVSKLTFIFISRLITLTAGQQIPPQGPVVTIPAR